MDTPGLAKSEKGTTMTAGINQTLNSQSRTEDPVEETIDGENRKPVESMGDRLRRIIEELSA